jgi:hypothetical protein
MKNFKATRTFKRAGHHLRGWKLIIKPVDWTQCVSVLHLANKQISFEYLSFLYSRVEFRFWSAKWLHEFCSSVSPSSLQYVRKVQLHIQTYGQPDKMKHVCYVDKFYAAWTKSIRKMAEVMPNVERLVVGLRVAESPLLFTFREDWAQMVLELRGLKGLKSVQVNLWSAAMKERYSWDDPSLEVRSPTIVKSATELHTAFATALCQRIKGKTERRSLANYKSLVQKQMPDAAARKFHRLVMGNEWVTEARRWDWVEKE